jgi:hypothetical protein
MVDQPARSVKGLGAFLPEGCGSLPGPYLGQSAPAQHEALMAEAGYRPGRDTPLARVLPWRILEFRHG